MLSFRTNENGLPKAARKRKVSQVTHMFNAPQRQRSRPKPKIIHKNIHCDEFSMTSDLPRQTDTAMVVTKITYESATIHVAGCQFLSACYCAIDNNLRVMLLGRFAWLSRFITIDSRVFSKREKLELVTWLCFFCFQMETGNIFACDSGTR